MCVKARDRVEAREGAWQHTVPTCHNRRRLCGAHLTRVGRRRAPAGCSRSRQDPACCAAQESTQPKHGKVQLKPL